MMSESAQNNMISASAQTDRRHQDSLAEIAGMEHLRLTGVATAHWEVMQGCSLPHEKALCH